MAQPAGSAALAGLLGSAARWATLLGVGGSLLQTSMYTGEFAWWSAPRPRPAPRATSQHPKPPPPAQWTGESRRCCSTGCRA